MTSIRLLQRQPDGEIVFREPTSGDVPAYAILSHTWGEEEVVFQDMEDNADMGKTVRKAGWEKIQFCAKQAEADGLRYFWIDTCCIDKENAGELGAAINSMFRWYQNAERCYVYLSDVSKPNNGAESQRVWEKAFRKSRWFTRGWTLQELLAPTSVEFFSQECSRLGDIPSLMQLIHETTRIPKAALGGAPLPRFSEKMRFSWIERRNTRDEEDKAYSLLGIFDVEMPLRYGEGSASAFKRLEEEIERLNKCLQDLRTTNPPDDKKRIEETKGGLLEGSYRWVLQNSDFQLWRNDEDSRLLWVKGDPGKGKTMLLCGIINELEKSKTKTALLSYFFCQATDSRINSATAVLRGLLYLLVSQQPSLVSHVRKRYDQAGKTMFEDANAWFALTEIFADVLRDPNLKTTYLLIDALDECDTDLLKLLDFAAKQLSASSRVKWLVSSRNLPDIEDQLERAGYKVRLSLELNAESVSAAVGVFIQQKVSRLAQQNQYNEQAQCAVLEYLTSNANDTFLWVALVCQDLQKTARRHVLKKIKLFPPGLDALYARMIQRISKSEDADLCKQVLAAVALVYRPISLEELAALVEQLEDITDDLELLEIIGLCGSFLTVQEKVIYFVHQSAKDFLLNKADKEVFPSGTEDVHYAIFARSLKTMSTTLHRDMFDLKALGYPIEDVKTPDPSPLAASRYSCIHWVDHLWDSNLTSFAIYVVDLHEFISKRYLYWLEALSLCRSIPKGVLSLMKLQSLVEGIDETGADLLTKLVQDAHRFIRSHKRAIELSPLQTYASALVFSPARSLIKDLFKQEEPKWIMIKPAIEDAWGACMSTLEGHSGGVSSVAFSHDSTRLASASWDRTVKIWDASSGACLSTLEGHSGEVSSVAFSHDSTRLASASVDGTVKIWDASSGACLSTLKGHSDWVSSVAFSHDSTRLASASEDRTVKIWDASSGACLSTLKGHSDWVHSVAFSHDSTRLASASEDRTVKVWDASSGACLLTLNISHQIYRISFDVSGSYLQTDIGTVDISALAGRAASSQPILNPCSPQYHGLTLSKDGVWIADNSENLLWLPSEYRPSCSAVSGDTICVGVGTGRVWIFKVECSNS